MAVKIVRDRSGEGVPFIDFVQRQVGRRPAQRVLAFIQEWEVLADELQREPAIEDYMNRWSVSRATAYNDQRLFQQAFPGERTPRRILEQLWNARGSEYGPLFAARVVGAVAGRQLAEGQLWLDEQGRFVRLRDVQGRQLHGETLENGKWRRWSAPHDRLEKARLIGQAHDAVWRFVVQVDEDPFALLEPLVREGIVIERAGSPSIDWELGRHLRAGELEGHVAAPSRAAAREKLLETAALADAHVDAASIRVHAAPV